jgi:RHS repeat-associated protein
VRIADRGDSLSLTLDPLGRAPSLKVAGATGTPVQLSSMSWNESGALTSLSHQVNIFSSPTWVPLAFERLDAIDSVGGALNWAWLRQDGATAPIDTLRDSVTYDGWQRVTRWASYPSAGGGAVVTRDYHFDALGNLDSAGQLYDATTNRLTKAAGGFLTYDRAGNLTAKLGGGGLTFGYDALERLVSVRQGAVLIARYGYDVAGRRIAKRVYSGATGGTVGYLRMVYAGNQVAFETDSNNTGLATLYTWGPGVDNLVAVQVGGTAYTVVTDALGSVRALVRRSDGAGMGRLRYDPYGQLIDSAGPQPALRTRWTGREWDAETGFYFHRSRYYDPGVGRFVQEDRIGYAGGGNLYAYVNGDVLQARDPDGLTKDATWAYLGWDAMCLGVDLCFGSGGEVPLLTGGATYGQRSSSALMNWSNASSVMYDLWVGHIMGFARNKALLTGAPIFREVYDGATPLTLGQFSTLFSAVFGGMNARNPSVILPNGVPVSARDAMGGFLARLLNGLVFENSTYVATANRSPSELSVAKTPYADPNFGAPTAIHAGRFFAPRTSEYIANYAIHEQMHSLSGYDGTSTYHCAITTAANSLVSGPALPCPR